MPVDLEAWEARGKAAVTMGSETETVRFVWQRTNEETETITLSGPLSMNRQIIERRGTALYQADGSALRPLVTTSESLGTVRCPKQTATRVTGHLAARLWTDWW